MGKFTLAIFGWVATMLGIGHDSTESEIHAATEKFKTREDFIAHLREEVKSEMDSVTAENTALKSGIAKLEETNSAQADQIKKLEAAIATKDARITELEAMPQADHTTGDEQPPLPDPASDKNHYLNQGMNARVQRTHGVKFNKA